MAETPLTFELRETTRRGTWLSRFTFHTPAWSGDRKDHPWTLDWELIEPPGVSWIARAVRWWIRRRVERDGWRWAPWRKVNVRDGRRVLELRLRQGFDRWGPLEVEVDWLKYVEPIDEERLSA